MIVTPSNLKTVVMCLWGEGRLIEAAKAFGCSKRTLNRWLAGDTIPPARYRAPIRRGVQNRALEVGHAAEDFIGECFTDGARRLS